MQGLWVSRQGCREVLQTFRQEGFGETKYRRLYQSWDEQMRNEWIKSQVKKRCDYIRGWTWDFYMASVGPRIHMPGVTLGRFCLVGRSQKFIQRRDRDGIEMRAVEKVSRAMCRVGLVEEGCDLVCEERFSRNEVLMILLSFSPLPLAFSSSSFFFVWSSQKRIIGPEYTGGGKELSVTWSSGKGVIFL